TISDADSSIQQLVARGAIKEVAAPPAVANVEAAVKVEQRAASDKVQEVPRTQPINDIKVAMTNQDNDPAHRVNDPDFRILKDGTVQVLHNPDKTNKKALTVEVERDQGDVSPPSAAQQKAVDGLVAYLSERYMQGKNDGTKDGVIEDPQGL